MAVSKKRWLARWRIIGRVFGRGLIVVLPAAITIYLLFWLLALVEGVMGVLADAVPLLPYFPGMGIVLTVIAIFFIGLSMRTSIFQRVHGWVDASLTHIPLVKSLYGSVRDLMDFFSGKKTAQMGQVVMVDIDGAGRNRLMGFLTRGEWDDVPEGIGDDDRVAVFLPMSYQLGGFTTIVPRSAVTPIDMSIEDAMTFCLTAGVKHSDQQHREGTPPAPPNSRADGRGDGNWPTPHAPQPEARRGQPTVTDPSL